MAEFVLKNLALLFDGYSFGSQCTSVSVNAGRETPDATAFDDGTRVAAAGGLKTAAITASGHFEAGTGTVDEQFQSAIAAAGKVITVAPVGLARGNYAYSLKATVGEYTPIQGSVGDVLNFTLTGGTTDELFRGIIEESATETGAAQSTGTQLGAISATQRIHAALHVTAFTGSSATVKVQSDDNSGFSSATDRITFSSVTGATAEKMTLDGAVTDDYWRVDISGTFSSITIYVILGIEPQ